MTGSRRRTDGDRGTWHPPVAPWLRRLGAAFGVLVVVLTLGTVVVQSYQADQARAETEYARVLTEWEDCRIDAITKSSVTDDLIGAILGTNKRIENSPTYDESKVPRRDLDRRLAEIQAKRQAALDDQAGCGAKPVRPT